MEKIAFFRAEGARVRNTRSAKMLHVARAMINVGGWMTAAEVADISGLNERTAVNRLRRMGEISSRWTGDEVFELRLHGDGRKSRQYRVRRISDSTATRKDLIIKYFSRKPSLTSRELAEIAGGSVSAAYEARKDLIENGVGVKRLRKQKPAEAPACYDNEREDYARCRKFDEIWPRRRSA